MDHSGQPPDSVIQPDFSMLVRPSSRVILVYASGPTAGKMVGTDLDSFCIGNSASSLVQVIGRTSDDPTAAVSQQSFSNKPMELAIHRRNDGWFAVPAKGTSFFHGQIFSNKEVRLRSGDMIRLGHAGNDFQFCLQTAGQSIQRVVDDHLPDVSSGASKQFDSQEHVEPNHATPTRATNRISDTVAAQANSGGNYSNRQTSLIDAETLLSKHREVKESWIRKVGSTNSILFLVVAIVILLSVLAFFISVLVNGSDAS